MTYFSDKPNLRSLFTSKLPWDSAAELQDYVRGINRTRSAVCE